ncbi:MAG: response regulator transcription factor [Candidatus Poribacteria bacterium]
MMGKRKILIVDDEADITDTLSFMLQARNFDVVTANNGKEGLAKVKKEHPDLVILDISMPEMDGYNVCNKLRQDNETKDIPIIMLTAKGETEAVIKSYESGANDYVVKPFNLSTLISRINNCLTN